MPPFSSHFLSQLLKFQVVFILLCCFFNAQAQSGFPDYDEINVELSVSRLGTYEIPVAIKGEDAYLPVTRIFDLLKIKNEAQGKLLQGFIIHPDSTYTINWEASEIEYKDRNFKLSKNDILVTPSENYLKSDLFGSIFGLDTRFSFRSLSVELDTDKELPVLKGNAA